MVSPMLIEETRSHFQAGMANGHNESLTNGVVASNGFSKAALSSPSRLIELARMITKETETLDEYVRESGCSMPGFDVDAPMDFPSLPEEIQRARQKVVESTQELRDLVVGPTEGLRWMAWDVRLYSKPSFIYLQPSGMEAFADL
jgi:hypothetical protein